MNQINIRKLYVVALVFVLAGCSLPSSRTNSIESSNQEPGVIATTFVVPLDEPSQEPEELALQIVLDCWNDKLQIDENGDFINPETGTRFRITEAESSKLFLDEADKANGFIWHGEVTIDYIRDQGGGWTDERVDYSMYLDNRNEFFVVTFRPGSSWDSRDLIYVPFSCGFS